MYLKTAMHCGCFWIFSSHQCIYEKCHSLLLRVNKVLEILERWCIYLSIYLSIYFLSFIYLLTYLFTYLFIIIWFYPHNSTDFLSPIPFSDWLIFCCRNLIHDQKKRNENNKYFLMNNI